MTADRDRNIEPSEWADWAWEDELAGARCGTSQMEIPQTEMDYRRSYESNESPLVPDDTTNSLHAISNESNWGYRALSYNPRSNQSSEPRNSSSGNTTRTSNTTRDEVLDPKYKVHSNSFFRVSRVFRVLWAEPTSSESTSEIRWSEHDEMFSEVRRFVVVDLDRRHPICLPIMTYSGQATLKSCVPEAHQHAIIYSPESSYRSTVPSNSDAKTKANPRWILDCEEYKDWRYQRSGRLWVVGSPGTGKTTAMATISRHLEAHRNPSEHIVSCSLDPDVKELNPSIAVLGKIVIELLLQEPADASHDVLRSQLKELICSGNSLSASRMKNIETKIRHSLRHVKLCVFVDGLDEYGQDREEQGVLIELIERLSRYDPDHSIKCVISSRSNFFQGRLFMGGSRIDLDSHPAHKECLERYVRDNLKDWNISRDPNTGERLAEEVTRKASGMFLWARLVVQELRLLIDRIPESLSLDEIITRLDNLSIFNLFAELLGRIKDCDQKAAFSMLRWVTYAAEPLHAQALVGALVAETGIDVEEASIIQICGGLLSIDENGLVRLLHSSVREYFQTRMKPNWKDVSNEANAIIAHACLKALSPERLLQSLNLSPRIWGESSDSEETRRQPHAFDDYAQSHWMFHYRLAEASSYFLAGLLHNSLKISLRKVQSWLHHESERTAQNSLGEGPRHSMQYDLDPLRAGLLVGARFGLPKLVKLELEMGASVDLVCGPEELTPLIWAVMNGHIEVVELFLRYDTNVEYRTRSGNNALIYAIANGHVEVVKLLLDHGAQSMDMGGNQGISTATEDLSLNVSFTSACDTCGALETVYELSSISSPIHTNQGKLHLQPIIVKGETASRAEIELAACESSHANTSATTSSMARNAQGTLKWLTGANMHKALEIAANIGIETVKQLLVVVGNGEWPTFRPATIGGLPHRPKSAQTGSRDCVL